MIEKNTNAITVGTAKCIKNTRFYLSNHIHCSLIDRQANLLFCSGKRGGEGVSCKIHTEYKPNGDDLRPYILEDKAENIWFGTRNLGLRD